MIFYLIVLDLYTHDPHKNEIPLSDISERTRINATRPCWEVQNGWRCEHRSFEIGHSDKWTGANRELQTYGGWVVRKVGSCELRTTNLS